MAPIYTTIAASTAEASAARIGSALLALTAMLTCRWTAYWAGLPMVDSLYCLTTILLLLGIHAKRTDFLLLALLIGPFAKEAFIFFVPLIFFFSHLPKWKSLLYIFLSAVVIVAFRYAYDQMTGFDAVKSMTADLGQVGYFKAYWLGMFNPKGLYKLLSGVGVWIILPIICFAWIPKYKAALRETFKRYMLVFVLIVLFHALFGQYERHFYLAMPLICLLVALSADVLRKQFGKAETEPDKV